MISKAIRLIRFALRVEPILLAYKAWGYTEDQVIARWRADLNRAASSGDVWGPPIGDKEVTSIPRGPGSDAPHYNVSSQFVEHMLELEPKLKRIRRGPGFDFKADFHGN